MPCATWSCSSENWRRVARSVVGMPRAAPPAGDPMQWDPIWVTVPDPAVDRAIPFRHRHRLRCSINYFNRRADRRRGDRVERTIVSHIQSLQRRLSRRQIVEGGSRLTHSASGQRPRPNSTPAPGGRLSRATRPASEACFGSDDGSEQPHRGQTAPYVCGVGGFGLLKGIVVTLGECSRAWPRPLPSQLEARTSNSSVPVSR